ncbi:TPA: recombinase family protein [Escherichia coli]|nr:recombinase family protein [Escherichia coli]HBE6910752.1 recombinase family protein [Escherichia coli]
MKYFYARVSTVKQDTARQMPEPGEYDDVFTDKASGANFNRPEWNRLMGIVRKGDEIHIHSLDRLGRTLKGIIDTVDELKKRGVILISRKEGQIGGGGAMGEAMYKLIAIFGELERNLMLERQAEQKAARGGEWKKRGPGKHTDADGIIDAWNAGRDLPYIMSKFKVSRATAYRYRQQAGIPSKAAGLN